MYRLMLALAVLPDLYSIPLSGQTISASGRVRMLISGGLLGKLDGFCETEEVSGSARQASTTPGPSPACPPETKPLGGLFGLKEKILKARTNDSRVLLSGNNFPKDFAATGSSHTNQFWDLLATLHAEVVALGEDDFLRAVFPAVVEGSVGNRRFDGDVRMFLSKGASKYRFLSSNAGVRTLRKGMNKVWGNGYELMISPDESLSWATAKLQISVPDMRKKCVAITVTENGTQKTPPRTVSVERGKVSLPMTLHPGAEYILKVDSAAQFQFQVDQAVTPWDNQPAALNGAPAAWLPGTGQTPPLLVAAMTDPALLDNLDSSRWKDKDGDGAMALVFYAPGDAAKSLFARVSSDANLATAAFPVLLSDFSDALGTQTVSLSSKWRIVSFNPDSHVLGCESGTSGCAKGRASDHQSGGYAIVDPAGGLARVWLRPEWVGETLLEVSGNVQSAVQWDDVHAASLSVDGYRRERRELVRSTSQKIALPPPSPAYEKQFARMMPGSKKRVWWQSRADMAVVIMDAMRMFLKTDLAMADQRGIDPDVIEELRLKAQNQMTDTIGPEQLLDILWRHDAYAVIKVQGKDLAAALGKLAKLQADDDGGSLCVRGLSGPGFEDACTIPEKVKADQIQVNGRYFVADQYYSIALPQSAARAAQLPYSLRNQANVFDLTLRYIKTLTPEKLEMISPEDPDAGKMTLRSRQAGTLESREKEAIAKGWDLSLSPPIETPGAESAPAAKPDPAPKPLKWKNFMAKQWLGLLYAPPVSVELGGQNFSVPDRQGKPDTSGFAAIPQVGEKAQHTFKFNLVGELHLTPIDLPAISLDIFSKANLNRLDTYPNSPTQFLQHSYTPDQWTNGAVLRSKFVTDELTKISAHVGRLMPASKRQSIRLQPFLGYFDDSSIFHYSATYARTADKAAFRESDAKPNYAYLGLGLEISQIGLNKSLSIKNTRIEQDWGINYAASKGVQIGNTLFNMDDVRRCGVQNLLDGTQGCTMAQDGPHEIRYRYATQRQSRRQFATTIEFSHGPDARKWTFSTDIKVSQWGTSSNGFTPLDPVRTAEFVLKSSLPIGAGISFGPYLRYLTVEAFGSSGNFVSTRYGFTLTVPVTAKTGHGRFFF